MTYHLELPKHLIKLVEAGEAVVNSGVIRNLSGKIIGHLEMANNMGGLTNILQIATPFKFFFSSAISIASIIQHEQIKKQNTTIITEVNNINENVLRVSDKIDLIGKMASSLQVLSWANFALTGINIGVNIAGFMLMNSKLNSFDEKLNRMEVLLSELTKNENKKLLKESKILIDKTSKHISDLSNKPINDVIENNISNTIIELKSLIEISTASYKNNDLINIPLDAIIASYYSYSSLTKAYYTSLYLENDNRYKSNKFVSDANKLKNELINSDMSDILYSTLINDLENTFSEEDLKIYDVIYKSSFQDNYDNLAITQEILNDTPLDEYSNWNEEIKKSGIENKILLVEHNV